MNKKLMMMIVVCIFIFTACSGPKSANNTPQASSPVGSPAATASTPQNIELEFWTINLKEGYSKYIEGNIAKYEQAHPGVKIKWVDVPDFDKTDAKLLAALSGGNIPDVVNLTPFMIPKFVKSGALASIDDIDPSVKAQFVNAFYDAGVVKGKAYGIPFYGSVPGVFINGKIFEQAGLDPNKPPTSWEQVKEYSETIKKKTGIAGTMQTIDNFADSGNPIDILARRGVKILNDDGTKAVFNSPEGVKVLQEFADMYKSGAMHADSLTGAILDAGKNFATGKVAMIFPGPWLLRWMKENSSEDTFKNVKVFPGIVGADGKLNSFLQTFVIPKKSKHPKEALDFAVFFSGTVVELTKQAPVAPSITKLLDDPYFTSGPEEIKIIKNGVPLAKFYWPLVPGLTEMIESLRNEFQQAALGKKDAQKALDDAVKKWNELLSK